MTRSVGRPPLSPDREPLVFVGFRADAETVAAIERLTHVAQQPGVVSPKSAAIRRAIIEAAARLDEATARFKKK